LGEDYRSLTSSICNTRQQQTQTQSCSPKMHPAKFPPWRSCVL
jgi:hypothetical protein